LVADQIAVDEGEQFAVGAEGHASADAGDQVEQLGLGRQVDHQQVAGSGVDVRPIVAFREYRDTAVHR